MNDTQREKIAKVYELVNRGVDGKKKAARNALDRLIAKYNLSDTDIENINKKEYRFKYQTELDLMLFQQLLVYFLDGKSGTIYKDTYGVKEVFIALEYLDFITISCSYEYFRRHMKKQYKKAVLPQVKRCRTSKTKNKRRQELYPIFFSKYILKSGIYKKDQVSKVDTSKMSGKEVADRISMQVEGGSYNKQVSNGLYLGQ